MNSTSDEVEVVDLDPEATDRIADAVVARLGGDVASPATKRLHGKVQPQRSELDDGAGFVVPKPGEAAGFGPYYGGDDKYSSIGETDAERATNLYIAKTLLETPDPRTGRPMAHPWTGEPLVSERLRTVMVNAATKAIRADPETLPAAVDRLERAAGEPSAGYRKSIDPDRFIAKGMAAARSQVKAMTSTGANVGDEWVPTFATSELWRDVHLQTEVAANIRRVDMPTNPYQLPTEISDVTFQYVSTENQSATASTVGTDKATLTAKKVQAEVDFSGEFTEDSIVPAIPSLRINLTRRGAQTIDDLIVHGDTVTAGTGNVNSDDAAPTAGAFYLALDGMRKFALVTNTGQKSAVNAALTSGLFNTARQLLGKYGARASDLRIVGGYSTVLSMLTITEVLTLEKYGPAATILRGELGRFYNIPILQSEAIPAASTDKVDADGKYTTTTPASNDTKGWFVLYNVNGWTTGFRREFQIESFRDITKDQNILVASFRMALIPSGISTLHTVAGYNVTV